MLTHMFTRCHCLRKDSATVDLHGLTLACAEVALRAWMLRLKFYHETGQLVDAATCQIITGANGEWQGSV